MKQLIIVVLTALISLSSGLTHSVELNPNHPEFHVVQPGDTLWDLSEKFLKSPWLWPEIWSANEQVGNPHLIYPGDIIALIYVDGKPRLVKTDKVPETTKKKSNNIIKLKPKARTLSAELAITTISLDAILPFLTAARVVSEEQVDNAAYVVSNAGQRLFGVQDNLVYLRGINNKTATKFSFFRKGKEYIDPETDELLGIEAVHIAEGFKIKSGDPATVQLSKSSIELFQYDRAWPTNEEQLRPVYFPHAPKEFKGGQIISVYGGLQQIGQYDIVVINRGERENMEVGHVLSIYTEGQEIVDAVATERSFLPFIDDSVELPDEYEGQLMIFRTFEKVSLALVLKAEKTIHILDKVTAPQ